MEAKDSIPHKISTCLRGAKHAAGGVGVLVYTLTLPTMSLTQKFQRL